MNKNFIKAVLVLLTCIFSISSLWAQNAPQKISYQAVIRNSDDELIASKKVGMKISILQGSETGTVMYSETQTPTTNANGLVSIEIGGVYEFNTINWKNGPYYIKTEIDPANGTNYSITGTSELLSVPYAFHSKTTEKVISNLTIGQTYKGGTIFYLDDTGLHGLIVAFQHQSSGMQWYNGTYRATGATGDGLGAGAMNTAIIVASQMVDNQSGVFAAKACADHAETDNNVTYGDWYLPSKYELNLLYQSGILGLSDSNYWSSTEGSEGYAWFQNFQTGVQTFMGDKSYEGKVIAIKAF